jgi:hypothetical protein
MSLNACISKVKVEGFPGTVDSIRAGRGKRPLGRPMRRWADNIKIDLREIGRDGMGWYGLD